MQPEMEDQDKRSIRERLIANGWKGITLVREKYSFFRTVKRKPKPGPHGSKAKGDN